MAMLSVADLTVDELKGLIYEEAAQTIRKLLADPDIGLELREDFKVELQQSLAAVQAGAKTKPIEEVYRGFLKGIDTSIEREADRI